MLKRLAYSWQHFLKAWTYTAKGLYAAVRKEEAFRQELVVLAVIIPLAFVVGESFLEYAVLIAVWLFVIACELLNSAIETLTDRVSKEHHKLAGRAKDYGSASVFVAIIGAALIWLAAIIT